MTYFNRTFLRFSEAIAMIDDEHSWNLHQPTYSIVSTEPAVLRQLTYTTLFKLMFGREA